ncbi:MAG: hypothetical protein Q9190_006905 [Brigantiaea leucoxantha]
MDGIRPGSMVGVLAEGFGGRRLQSEAASQSVTWNLLFKPATPMSSQPKDNTRNVHIVTDPIAVVSPSSPPGWELLLCARCCNRPREAICGSAPVDRGSTLSQRAGLQDRQCVSYEVLSTYLHNATHPVPTNLKMQPVTLEKSNRL